MEVGNELSKTVSALPSTISYFNLVASTVFQHSVAFFWLLGCYHLLCSDINETDIYEKIFSGKKITKKILVERQLPTINDAAGKVEKEKSISSILSTENWSSSKSQFLQLEICFKV